jgi:hypothetical protein
MAKRYLAALVLGVLALASAAYLNVFAPAPSPPPASALVSALSPSRYMQDVVYLASDAMRGRGDGSPELDRAADYIAQQFALAGLQPAGEGKTYFQNFEITMGAQLGPHNLLQIDGKSLVADRDFAPIVFSSTADYQGPLIFAGYGITAPEFHYDDYGGIDAHGKIVVVLQHEPQERDPHSVFAGTNLTTHASFVNKTVNAKLHGAKGIIFITDFNHENEDVGPATSRDDFAEMGIPAVHVKREFVMNAFKRGGKDLAALQKTIDTSLQPQSFELPGVEARIATDVIRSRKTIKNVIGAIAGSDPRLKNEWVVVGAHYDHLGLGNRKSARSITARTTMLRERRA